MKILITGGLGFIGSHLAEYHLSKGDDVFIIDNISGGKIENSLHFKSHSHFQYEISDLTTWKNLKKMVRWAERIYHMAALVGILQVLENPVKMLNVNIMCAERLFHAASHDSTAQIILASSSSVYGDREESPLAEDFSLNVASTKNPFSAYVISKLANESFAMSYYKKKSVPMVIARLFNVIGPRQTGRYGMVIPRFVEQACNNKPITVFGDGKQTRSFCDVRDVVIALDQIACNPKSMGEIVNVGQDIEISIHDLALLVKDIAKSDSPIQFIPYETAYGIPWDEITQRCPDLTKLKLLSNGFVHQWSLRKTLENLIFSKKVA